MPGGMTGLELAEAALAIKLSLKILFTSGYAEPAIARLGQRKGLAQKALHGGRAGRNHPRGSAPTGGITRVSAFVIQPNGLTLSGATLCSTTWLIFRRRTQFRLSRAGRRDAAADAARALGRRPHGRPAGRAVRDLARGGLEAHQGARAGRAYPQGGARPDPLVPARPGPSPRQLVAEVLRALLDRAARRPRAPAARGGRRNSAAPEASTPPPPAPPKGDDR